MSELFKNVDTSMFKKTTFEELKDADSDEYLSVLKSKSECGKLEYTKVTGYGKKTAPRLTEIYSKFIPARKIKSISKRNKYNLPQLKYEKKPSFAYRISLKRKSFVRFIEKHGVALIMALVFFAACFMFGGAFINSVMETYKSLGPTLSLILIIVIAASIFGN